jgi:hypothetical protein
MKSERSVHQIAAEASKCEGAAQTKMDKKEWFEAGKLWERASRLRDQMGDSLRARNDERWSWHCMDRLFMVDPSR